MKLAHNRITEFVFGDLIDDIYKGKAINKGELTKAEGNDVGIRYITRTAEDNGCELIAQRDYIQKDFIEAGNAISIGDTTATCFYQNEEFIVGDHMVVVRANWLNKYRGLYITTLLNKEQYKYSYGRAFVMDKIKNTVIYLPSTTEGEPDWQYIEDYIKSLHSKPITTKNDFSKKRNFARDRFAEFVFGDLIDDIYKGKAINKGELTKAEGNDVGIRYITRTAEDNGCELIAQRDYIQKDFIEAGNAISIGDTTATCFYQNEEFIVGDHMVVVRANWLNKYRGLYITTLLNKEQYKYSYGRAFVMDKIKNTVLYLPSTSEGEPDWQYMEDYIKSLPYGDRI